MKKIFTKTGCRVHIFRNDKQKDSEPFTFIALNSEWAEITYLEEITILNESEFEWGVEIEELLKNNLERN